MTGRTAAKWGRTVKKLVGKLFVWSISPSRRVFFRDKNRIAFRKEMNCLPQRRNFSAARQFLRVQKEGKNRASEGFSRSGWSPPACKSRLPFCKPFPRGADAGEVPKRMPFRVKQQSVAKIGSRLSSCIPLGARGSHISVLFPSPARLRGSRRGCLDVLTKCHLGLAAVRKPFDAFATGGGRRHRNRQGSSQGPSFFPFRNAEIYGCPHWISTEPK